MSAAPSPTRTAAPAAAATPFPRPALPFPASSGAVSSGTYLVLRSGALWVVSAGHVAEATRVLTGIPSDFRYLDRVSGQSGDEYRFVREVGTGAQARSEVFVASSGAAPTSPRLTLPGTSIVPVTGSRWVAYHASDGVHLADAATPAGSPLLDRHLLVDVPCTANNSRDCVVYRPIGASPDGRELVVVGGHGESGSVRAFDLASARFHGASVPTVGLGWAPQGARACGGWSSYGGPQNTIGVADLTRDAVQTLDWPAGRAPDDLYGKEVRTCRWSMSGEIAVLTGTPQQSASARQGYSVVFFDAQLRFSAAHELPEVRLVAWASDDSGAVLEYQDAYYVLDRAGALRALDVGGGAIVDTIRPTN